MKRKRTTDEQKIEQNSHYEEMETCKPPDEASTAFNRKAYKSIDVMDYVRKIHKGGDSVGNDKGTVSIVQKQSTGNC
ncbi:MAG: hypothetical protein ACLUEC_09805 [Coprococcus sp.]